MPVAKGGGGAGVVFGVRGRGEFKQVLESASAVTAVGLCKMSSPGLSRAASSRDTAVGLLKQPDMKQSRPLAN